MRCSARSKLFIMLPNKSLLEVAPPAPVSGEAEVQAGATKMEKRQKTRSLKRRLKDSRLGSALLVAVNVSD